MKTRPPTTASAGDGIPDTREIRFGNNPTNAAETAGNLDNDGASAAQPLPNPFSAIPNGYERDTAGNIIQNLDTTNPMVERDPIATPAITDASTQRIAWREVKVKVGKIHTGKTVTWSMTEPFTPHRVTTEGTATTAEVTAPDGDPRFRGAWFHAEHPPHTHGFSPSTTFGGFGFTNKSPNDNGDVQNNTDESDHDNATTTVAPDGHTAIRVNLPPIGFNKARISIQVEGTASSVDLLDLEVPAAVVMTVSQTHRPGGRRRHPRSARPSCGRSHRSLWRRLLSLRLIQS